MMTGTTLMLATLTILCTSFAQLLQKQAALDIGGSGARALLLSIPFIQSIILLGTGMAIWLLVLKRVDVSIAYPLLSINFILVQLLARWKFGEKIPLHRMVGSLIIIAGLSLLFTG